MPTNKRQLKNQAAKYRWCIYAYETHGVPTHNLITCSSLFELFERYLVSSLIDVKKTQILIVFYWYIKTNYKPFHFKDYGHNSVIA